MKFSGKMWLMIILKFTKNQRFTISVEDAFFGKPQWWLGGILGLNQFCSNAVFIRPIY